MHKDTFVGMEENGSRASAVQGLQKFLQELEPVSPKRYRFACVYGAYKIGKTTVIERATEKHFLETKEGVFSIDLRLNKEGIDEMVEEASEAILEYIKKQINSNQEDLNDRYRYNYNHIASNHKSHILMSIWRSLTAWIGRVPKSKCYSIVDSSVSQSKVFESNASKATDSTSKIIEVLHKFFELHYKTSEKPTNMIRDVAEALALLNRPDDFNSISMDFKTIYESFSKVLQTARSLQEDIRKNKQDNYQLLESRTCGDFLESLTNLARHIGCRALHIIPPPSLIKTLKGLDEWSEKFSISTQIDTLIIWELHHNPEFLIRNGYHTKNFFLYSINELSKEEIKKLVKNKLNEYEDQIIEDFSEHLPRYLGAHPFFLDQVCEIISTSNRVILPCNTTNIQKFIQDACNHSEIKLHRSNFASFHVDLFNTFLRFELTSNPNGAYQNNHKYKPFGIFFEDASNGNNLYIASFYRDFHRDNQKKELSETLTPLEAVFPHSWQDLYAVIVELTAPGDDCSSLRFLRGNLEEKLRSDYNWLIAAIKSDVYTWLSKSHNISLYSLRDVANRVDIERASELEQMSLAERIKDTIIPQNKLVRLMEALLQYLP